MKGDQAAEQEVVSEQMIRRLGEEIRSTVTVRRSAVESHLSWSPEEIADSGSRWRGFNDSRLTCKRESRVGQINPVTCFG
jgi:hypothetical protein